MENIIIKFSSNSFFSKHIFINNKYYGKTKSDEIKLEGSNEEMNITVKMFCGFYTSKIYLPKKENKNYYIFFTDRYSDIYRIIYLFALIIVTIVAIFFNFASMFSFFMIFGGIIFCFILFDIIIRKKRYKITIYELNDNNT